MINEYLNFRLKNVKKLQLKYIFLTINLISFSLSLLADDLDIIDIDIAASCPSQISPTDLQNISNRFGSEVTTPDHSTPTYLNGILWPRFLNNPRPSPEASGIHTNSNFTLPSVLNYIDETRKLNLAKNMELLELIHNRTSVHGDPQYWNFVLFYNTYTSIKDFNSNDRYFEFLNVLTSKYVNQSDLITALEKWTITFDTPFTFAPQSLLLKYYNKLTDEGYYSFKDDELGTFLETSMVTTDSNDEMTPLDTGTFNVLYNLLYLHGTNKEFPLGFRKRVLPLLDPHDILVHATKPPEQMAATEAFMKITQTIPKTLFQPELFSPDNSLTSQLLRRKYSLNFQELKQLTDFQNTLTHEGYLYLQYNFYYEYPRLKINGNRGFNAFLFLKKGDVENFILKLLPAPFKLNSNNVKETAQSDLREYIKGLKYFEALKTLHPNLIEQIFHYVNIMGLDKNSLNDSFTELESTIRSMTGLTSRTPNLSYITKNLDNRELIQDPERDTYDKGMYDLTDISNTYKSDTGVFLNHEVMRDLMLSLSHHINKKEKLSQMFSPTNQINLMNLINELLEKYIAIVKEKTGD